MFFVFFFQAEDGIRDFHVTGVQTCALPISGIDFEPGAPPGSVSGELGLRRFLEERVHAFVVTSDKEGPDSLERELPEAEIVISEPFWPAYLTSLDHPGSLGDV